MHRTAVAATLVALTLVAGCGSDDADPAPSGATSPPTPAGSSPTGAGTGASADVATGPRLTRANSSVVAPEGWTRGRKLSRDEAAADSPDHLSYVSLAEVEAFGSSQGAAELGRTRVRSSLYPTPPTLRPTTELDGVPVYHVSGQVSSEQYVEEYGAIRNDRIVILTLSFNRRVPEAERRRVLTEVLPTFRWR